jgi:hypothetical protein
VTIKNIHNSLTAADRTRTDTYLFLIVKTKEIIFDVFSTVHHSIELFH